MTLDYLPDLPEGTALVRDERGIGCGFTRDGGATTGRLDWWWRSGPTLADGRRLVKLLCNSGERWAAVDPDEDSRTWGWLDSFESPVEAAGRILT